MHLGVKGHIVPTDVWKINDSMLRIATIKLGLK